MKHIFFLLFVLLSLSLLQASTSALTGGWRPISDVKDPHVVEIAKFAVSDYNRQNKATLKFETVIQGETQVVSGTNYRLLLAANDSSGTSKNYEAVVWEKPWLKSMILTSFNPATTGPSR